MHREPIVYASDRPDVEVLWEASGARASCGCSARNPGQWLCNVQYRRPGELSSHIDTFRASEVRGDAKGDSTLVDDPVRGAIDTTLLDSTTKLDSFVMSSQVGQPGDGWLAAEC